MQSSIELFKRFRIKFRLKFYLHKGGNMKQSRSKRSDIIMKELHREEMFIKRIERKKGKERKEKEKNNE